MKDTVVYPHTFHGILGDNVYKFVKEFKEAVVEIQVKKSDQVKTPEIFRWRSERKVWRSLHRPGICADRSD